MSKKVIHITRKLKGGNSLQPGIVPILSLSLGPAFFQGGFPSRRFLPQVLAKLATESLATLSEVEFLPPYFWFSSS